jgi:hypothetical protein
LRHPSPFIQSLLRQLSVTSRQGNYNARASPTRATIPAALFAKAVGTAAAPVGDEVEDGTTLPLRVTEPEPETPLTPLTLLEEPVGVGVVLRHVLVRPGHKPRVEREAGGRSSSVHSRGRQERTRQRCGDGTPIGAGSRRGNNSRDGNGDCGGPDGVDSRLQRRDVSGVLRRDRALEPSRARGGLEGRVDEHGHVAGYAGRGGGAGDG